ncbi:DMT family transporter [Streptomyces sp. NBC_01304]|uniref:DMT family transporter n=1 Tax=Streptomyces sp. NBC_01304 TaxID=2903818 RepID=UPI002E113AD9|nr:DMT family transporter [Streptomyces sp. NBC_01304]
MSAIVTATALATVSSAAYAGAAVLQERLAARAPAGSAAKSLLSRGPGLCALAFNGIGAALHVVALRFGPLSLVQSLGILTVVLAVLLGAAVARRRTGRHERYGAALATLGLLAFTQTLAPSSAARALSLPATVLLTSVIAGLALALSRLVHPRPVITGIAHATAAGLVFALGSVLSQTVSVRLAEHGPHALLSAATWLPALLIVPASSIGLLLSQRAYRGGLDAPLATVTVANPAASAVIGLVLLGEQLRGGAAPLLAVAAALVAVAGVALLSRQAAAAQMPTAQTTAAQTPTVQATAVPVRPVESRRDPAEARLVVAAV